MQHQLFSTTIKRHFLGWDTPLIPSAIAWLQRYVDGQKMDLTGVTIVLPTRRSVEQLKRSLDAFADTGVVDVHQGWIGTVGSLPEELYDRREILGSTTKLLSDLERTLFWTETLRQTASDELTTILSQVPPLNATASWMSLAKTIDRLYIDLASAGVSFEKVADELSIASEKRRWTTLNQLLARYRSGLKDLNRSDVHQARQIAIERNQCRSKNEMVLIGCTDLSPTLTRMIQQVQSPVHALVCAPPAAEAMFDSIGNVDRQPWATFEIETDLETWIAAGDTGDQAEVTAALVDRFEREDDLSPSEITIGVTDQSQVAPIEFATGGRGKTTFRNLGYKIGETAVGSLVRLVSAHLRERTWATLAGLVRHPDALATLGGDDAAIKNIDDFRAETYPVRVDDQPPIDIARRHADALQWPRRIDQWLDSINRSDQSLSQRCEAIEHWITETYRMDAQDISANTDIPKNTDTPSSPVHPRTASAAQSLIDWLHQHRDLDESVDPTISVSAMMEVVLAATETLRIPDQCGGEINILGWLDLALDDAPAMIVTGMNHPFVPEAVTSDAFLPGSLRTKFRIADNERRYARDAHYLRCITASRPHVKLVVGRTSADGSPTPPSRLVAAANPDHVSQRIRRLLDPTSSIAPPPHHWDTIADAPLTRPDLSRLPAPTIDRMSVTSFKNYLTCPYRFYLRHVLNLKPIDDTASELAANQFGDLVHNSLEIFGLSSNKDDTDPRKIESAMHDALSQYAKQIYGRSTSAAVQLQIHQARRKLSRVAIVQAERIAAGWRIDRVEAAVNQDVAFIEIDGKRMGLRGRFDRIDHHAETGRYAILDYKTHGFKPEKKHLDKDEQWIDLQLPLYRRMIPFLNIQADPDNVEVGYFNIADKDPETKINLASFTPDQWQSANDLIDDIVRRIFSGDFQPAENPPQYDDYAMILHEGVVS